MNELFFLGSRKKDRRARETRVTETFLETLVDVAWCDCGDCVRSIE